jgi:hypothetical protein
MGKGECFFMLKAKNEDIEFLKKITEESKGVHQIFSDKKYFDENNVEKRFVRYVKSSEIVDSLRFIDDKHNYYITLNSLRKWQRNTSNVLSLNAFYVDCDCEKISWSKADTLFFIQQTLDDMNLPLPTATLDSGHGLYFVWQIESVIVNSKIVLDLWGKIEKVIIEKFGIFGDSTVTSAVQLLRLPTSINVKDPTKPVTAHVLELNDVKYSLSYFQNELLPEKRKKRCGAKKFEHKNKISVQKNGYTLDSARSRDLIKLLDMRNGVSDKREITLFLYANSLIRLIDSEDIKNALVKFNQRFEYPLPKKEIESKIFNQLKFDRYYKYKNETIIRLLEITDDEQKSLETIISSSERIFRKTEMNRKRKNKIDRVERNRRVIEMYNQKYSKKEIAKKLKISQPTIRKILKDCE